MSQVGMTHLGQASHSAVDVENEVSQVAAKVKREKPPKPPFNLNKLLAKLRTRGLLAKDTPLRTIAARLWDLDNSTARQSMYARGDVYRKPYPSC